MSEESLVGRTIGEKYRLDALVGAGSMGTVYRATQLALHKTVAIKVMKVEFAREATYSSRFKREAKAASRLDHPNSLRVLDFGDDGGLLYIAMEFLDGRDLLTVVSRDWPLAVDRIVDLMAQTLAALAVAHEMGIVHRDLKPENVMVLRGKDDEGRAVETVKVCDFGVAKLLPERRGDDETQSATATGTLTATGMLVGTPEYMSPEQVIGEALDARSDLYSLGIILYQLLTRTLPFEDKSPIKLAMKQIDEKPRPPSEVYAEVDPRLEAICMKALSKAPDDRFANAREMRAELRGVMGTKDSAILSAREPLPPVSARVVPMTGAGEPRAADEALLAKAATLLQSRPPAAMGASTLASPTSTQPSAQQLRARQQRRWIAALAIAFALVVLLVLAR